MSRRILIVMTNSLGIHGITNVVLNHYNYFKYDFVISSGAMESNRRKIESMGGKIFDLPSRTKNPLRYIKNLKKIISENRYRIVHVHGNSGTMALDIHVAKLAGAEVRIAHCHNSSAEHKLAHKILKPILNRGLTHALACSDIAGKWAFSVPFSVIKNGIEVEKFIFNKQIREDYRKKLNISDEFVIGHIGHMSFQKNHEFLINVFSQIFKVNKNTKLLLVGDGDKRTLIEEQINNLNLKEAVLILGKRTDVEFLVQAMDIFVLPSRYEGLGIVNIEAQTAGLKCIVSNTIPIEAKVCHNLEFLSLNESLEIWRDSILKYVNGYERKNMFEEINNSGYDIKEVVKKMEQIYNQ